MRFWTPYRWHCICLPAKKQFPRDIGKERPCLNHHLGNCDGWCRPEMTEEAYRERIASGSAAAGGRVLPTVEQQLREQMECASEELRFEAAAEYRDRHPGDPAVGLPAEGSGLLCGRMWTYAACLPGDAKSCFTVLHFLAGDLGGPGCGAFPHSYGGGPGGEVLSALVKQYYGGRGNLPRGILLPWEVEDREELAADVHRGTQAERWRCSCPSGAIMCGWWSLPAPNAREEAERVSTDYERTNKTLELLGSMLKLENLPRRLESYDISNMGSDDIVALYGGFCGRPALEKGL